MEDRIQQIARRLAVQELVNQGNWVPADERGNRESFDDATHVACVECGKVFKANQSKRIARHENMHTQKNTEVLEERLNDKQRGHGLSSYDVRELSRLLERALDILSSMEREANKDEQKHVG